VGTNALLTLGAAPLTGAQDVLSVYGLSADDGGAPHELLDLLPASAAELVRRTGRPAAEIARELVELELAGRVRSGDGIFRNAVPRG